MGPFKGTHRTRAGVEVMAVREDPRHCVRVYWRIPGDQHSDALYTSLGFAALFEPIPTQVTVEITLAMARKLNSNAGEPKKPN